MHKIYSLLRNNKQSGPYTLEELLHLNLKPFDLVWVEGKSGGWSYPSEIDALKPFISEKIKTADAEKNATQQQPPETVSKLERKPEVIAGTDNTQPKTNHIYISLPSNTRSNDNNIGHSNPSVGEETPEAKLERKAQELRNKIQAFAESKKQPKADTDPDVKYSRSLDDIKQEYSSWLYQQKKKQNVFSKKTAFMVAGAAAVMIAVYFMFSVLLPTQKNSSGRILSAQEILTSAPVIKASNDTLYAGKITATATTTKQPGKKINSAKSTSTTANDSYLKKEVKKVETYLDSLNAVQKKSQTQKQTVYEPTSKKADGTREKAVRSAEATADNSSVKNETNSVPFEELVKLAESNNGTPHLTLYNNSNKFIKFVAVDVYYYKANKKLLQKKTLYFTDISAMSVAKLFVPEEKKAASVRYEMGLISTGGGLYYAKK